MVGNYLKGETPPPFDLLYWNSDSTNLPGPMYAWYLRNTYLENNLVKPGKCTVCGEKVDLRKVDLPVYIYGSREDHIVPIGGAYASTKHLPGQEALRDGRLGPHRRRDQPAGQEQALLLDQRRSFPETLEQWLEGAKEHPGSWWTDWSSWLKAPRGQADRRAQELRQGQSTRPSSPRPAAT